METEIETEIYSELNVLLNVDDPLGNKVTCTVNDEILPFSIKKEEDESPVPSPPRKSEDGLDECELAVVKFEDDWADMEGGCVQSENGENERALNNSDQKEGERPLCSNECDENESRQPLSMGCNERVSEEETNLAGVHQQEPGSAETRRRLTCKNSYNCSECSYSSPYLKTLERHARIHTGEKLYSCNECSYSCIVLSSLKRHSLLHTGEKPLSCSHCSYRCRSAYNLKRHQRVHSRPFRCTLCSFSCTQLTKLKQHIMLTHSSEQTFSCIECTDICNSLPNFKKHMRIHSGEKPFSCSECGCAFAQSSNLKQHMLKHTGGKPSSCAATATPDHQNRSSISTGIDSTDPPGSLCRERGLPKAYGRTPQNESTSE